MDGWAGAWVDGVEELMGVDGAVPGWGDVAGEAKGRAFFVPSCLRNIDVAAAWQLSWLFVHDELRHTWTATIGLHTSGGGYSENNPA